MIPTLCNLALGCLLGMGANPGAILYDSGNPPQGTGPGLYSSQWFAQQFTVGPGWQMAAIGVFAAGTQPITMVLAQDANGLPGNVVGSWTIDKVDWDAGGSWGWTPATFSFVSGANYWFEYTSYADIFDGGLLPAPAPNGNPDVAFSSDQGASWTLATAGPLGLRIEAAASVITPEPGTLSLVCLGLLFLVIWGTRVRSAKALLKREESTFVMTLDGWRARAE